MDRDGWGSIVGHIIRMLVIIGVVTLVVIVMVVMMMMVVVWMLLLLLLTLVGMAARWTSRRGRHRRVSTGRGRRLLSQHLGGIASRQRLGCGAAEHIGDCTDAQYKKDGQ